ncbi:ABC transporter ATP-binding protein [Haloarcula sp. S1CR25-12]|uniref:ABC transporter ATP-binding protein n=1 Tax=Haloarcula saliterrae TaxID=2950534 RepID=A0ABU2FGU4_9EURY|nr:ABC transporter ATP-binding protein [Haloarcula sp. S1CR25-12]MDS0260961.1 ABC transporter ATP-binding protein [Haloarcula sp. S1CR25-12]
MTFNSETSGLQESDSRSASESSVATKEVALKVEGLTKQFDAAEDAVTAVDDVSFSVPRNSVVGLLGPNGAGKTTTIKSILGLVKPDEGDIEINGVDARANPHRMHEHVDAMLEGARNDYWRLTVEENLRYFAGLSGTDPTVANERYTDLLEKFDLDDKRDVVVRNLSRGMKQKVSVASVLASESSIVFLDEPTLGLDVESTAVLRRELTKIIDERDLTVFLSSHDMDVIEAVCDRVIIMEDGRIIANEQVDALLEMFDRQRFEIEVEGLDNDVRSTIERSFPTAEIESVGDRIQVAVSVGDDGFYSLMSHFQQYSVSIVDIATGTPDMENVFLELIGRDDD